MSIFTGCIHNSLIRSHFIAIFWFLSLSLVAFTMGATHNRAGEITYTHRPDLGPYTYEVKVQTCTKSSSFADRPWLKIRFGDETLNTPESELDSLPRVEIIPVAGQDAQINIYYGFHTYPSPGIFDLVVEDPNRNAGVQNIKGSVNVFFTIQSTLIISPTTGHNNSVQLLNPPKERACLWQPWIHNPGAYDPDGDSLVYSLIPCRGEGNVPISVWELPDASTSFPGDVFAIDAITGNVTWNVPPQAGEYNIAILIEEFRNGILVGNVIRDMQIDVITCPNIAPQIADISDYCIEADETLEIGVIATDANNNTLNLTAYGGPMSQVEHPASFDPIAGFFIWTPRCEEVRQQPYAISFEVTDNGNIPLTDIETVQITVVAPSVENPLAEAEGNSIALSWDASPCSTAFTTEEAAQVRYKIYRRAGEYGFVPDECELGVPGYTGYVQIAETSGLSTTSYTDNDVFYGGVYCYMVVTCWPDGAISYASEEFCDTIKKDAPVITKVSIGFTDLSLGVDTVWWSPPTDLDTTVFEGPFQYKLMYRSQDDTDFSEVYASDVSDFLVWDDTTFIHQGLNTRGLMHYYRVDFFSGNELVRSSSEASSSFLVLTPGDNSMQISVNAEVPWTITSIEVYRRDPGALDFEWIGSAPNVSYVDTGLVNTQEYCYRVMCFGSYNSSFIPDSLINFTQEACAIPYDQTPPCPPLLTVWASCEDQTSTLTWTFPDRSCAQDVMAYNVYHSPVEGGPLTLLMQIEAADDTAYIYNLNGVFNSIAGCFAVTALDSLNPWPDGSFRRNESALSNVVCVDNCPYYFMPNAFSPNNDGSNDVLRPIGYRFVQDIDLKIFNRWGTLVFETTDPSIGWNGVAKDSGEPVSAGTYYYVIVVNTLRLSGVVSEQFSGYLQVFDPKQPASNN
jgi:gliding motility-associated-like protein